MDRIGRQLLRESKAEISGSGAKVEKSSLQGRDLLSLLVRANMATDVPDSQRMTDEDVLARAFFFLSRINADQIMAPQRSPHS